MPKKQDSVTLEIYNPDNMYLEFYKENSAKGLFRWRIYEIIPGAKRKIRYCCDEGYSFPQCKLNAQFFCSNVWDVPTNFDEVSEDLAKEGY